MCVVCRSAVGDNSPKSGHEVGNSHFVMGNWYRLDMLCIPIIMVVFLFTDILSIALEEKAVGLLIFRYGVITLFEQTHGIILGHSGIARILF